jgi:hypothetical protein
MMKVALRNAEYMANLPPYRFAPGDVIEIEDDWAAQLIRRGIAIKARADAKTAIERHVEMRPPPADDGGAAVRAARRAALLAELAALGPEDAVAPTEGHYGDMIGRGDAEGTPEPRTARPTAQRARTTAQRAHHDADAKTDAGDE